AAFALGWSTVIASAAEPLVYAPLPMENLSHTQTANQPLADLLDELLEQPVEMRLYETHSDLLDALSVGEVDLAHLGPLPLLLAKARTPSLVELAVFREADGSAQYRCVIAAPLDGLTNLTAAVSSNALPTLALTREESTCGPTAAFTILSEQGLDPRRFLATYLGGHDEVARAVLLQTHQIGGLKESVAQVWSDLGLRVLAASQPLPGMTLLVSPGSLSTEEIEALRDALLGLDKDRLAPLQIGRHGFARFDPGLLERVRTMRAKAEPLINEVVR
ncbi:MAG TPA: PhnD/SsuA/transferrin family substrate-binding protein, partial [Wenzhouxiangella sp.]|nr:PhnD/SsuA/transferrin family substrate-binding protein [Wenzhouxiangella sp.]